MENQKRQQEEFKKVASQVLNLQTKLGTNTNSFNYQLNNLSKFKQNRLMIVDDEEFCISSMKTMI